MALTKVKVPVAEISLLANTTSSIDIPTAAADIDVTVAGVSVGTFSITGLDLGLLALTASSVVSEDISLSTTSGASMTVKTTATEGQVSVTSAHPLLLVSNALTGLTVGTDGKVTLGVQGTATTHLVDKSYVDNAATTASAQLADMVLTEATKGSMTIPSSTGNDFIINWETTASISGTTAVTFDTAFPNAFLAATVTRETSNTSIERECHYSSPTTSGMNVIQSSGVSTPVCYIAIGY